MKYLGMLCVMFMFLGGTAQAATITNCNKLTWDANTEPDLAGYHIHVNKDGVDLPTMGITAPSTEIPCDTVKIVEGSDYIVYLTAYDQSGNESAPGGAIAVEWPDAVPPTAPTGTCLQYTDAAGDLQCVVVP